MEEAPKKYIGSGEDSLTEEELAELLQKELEEEPC